MARAEGGSTREAPACEGGGGGGRGEHGPYKAEEKENPGDGGEEHGPTAQEKKAQGGWEEGNVAVSPLFLFLYVYFTFPLCLLPLCRFALRFF